MRYLLLYLRTFVPYSLMGKPFVRVALWFKGWRVVSVGAETQPRRGGVIYVANHIHVVDSLALGLTLRRQATFLAKSEYYAKWWMGLILWLIGAIPVDRSGGKADEPLARAKRRLQAGGVVAIHGEGTRSRDGYLHNMRTGFVDLAKSTQAEVVPTALVYAGDRYVEVRYGASITYAEYESLKPYQFAELVTRRIYELDPTRPRSGRLAKITSIGVNAIKALTRPRDEA